LLHCRVRCVRPTFVIGRPVLPWLSSLSFPSLLPPRPLPPTTEVAGSASGTWPLASRFPLRLLPGPPKRLWSWVQECTGVRQRAFRGGPW
jgi:hypothetical protein